MQGSPACPPDRQCPLPNRCDRQNRSRHRLSGRHGYGSRCHLHRRNGYINRRCRSCHRRRHSCRSRRCHRRRQDSVDRLRTDPSLLPSHCSILRVRRRHLLAMQFSDACLRDHVAARRLQPTVAPFLTAWLAPVGWCLQNVLNGNPIQEFSYLCSYLSRPPAYVQPHAVTRVCSRLVVVAWQRRQLRPH